MAFLIFDAERTDYDNENDKPVTLSNHLEYLRTFGGTPDNLFEAFSDRHDAMREAKKYTEQAGREAWVVDEDSDYRVTHISRL